MRLKCLITVRFSITARFLLEQFFNFDKFSAIFKKLIKNMYFSSTWTTYLLYTDYRMSFGWFSLVWNLFQRGLASVSFTSVRKLDRPIPYASEALVYFKVKSNNYYKIGLCFDFFRQMKEGKLIESFLKSLSLVLTIYKIWALRKIRR